MDMVLSAYQLGPKYEDYLLQKGNFRFGLQLGAGVIFSTLTIDEKLVINEEIMADDFAELESTGWFVEPMLVASYEGFDNFNLKINDGLTELMFKKKLADWSGMRFLFGVDYRLDFR